MDTHIFITGASSGIGRGITQNALNQGIEVTGIQRRKGFNHDLYEHSPVDLLDKDAVEDFLFSTSSSAKRWVLINNAGTIGDIKPVVRLNAPLVEKAIYLNLTVPIVLSQKFLRAAEDEGIEPVIVNISSGAASYAIPSWSVYSATKAGLEQFTQVLKADYPHLHCMAISPGIVDSEMQDAIRQSHQDDFPELERFISYKSDNELQSPLVVGRKILNFALNPKEIPSVSFSLRNVQSP